MYEIKDSPTHGKGVFATIDIKQNTLIYKYEGEEMSYNEFVKRYGKYKENSQYTYSLRRVSKMLVAKEEPYKSKNICNFINEALNPNVYLKKRGLYSNRLILRGEEFFLKYPEDYKRDYILK